MIKWLIHWLINSLIKWFIDCFICVQGNNLTVVHVSTRQPMPGLALGVTDRQTDRWWWLIHCFICVQGNNLTVVHVSARQPMPGLALGVSVDLLESEFVHEGRGSRVSREQFMMVLSDIRVLHIRASYYSTVSRVLYVYHSFVSLLIY